MQSQLGYTFEQFLDVAQVGRTKAYEEIASGRLTTYKVGRRRYISARALDEWQRKLEAETEGLAKSFWEQQPDVTVL
jgi:excisionase family DNA binding protein